MLDFFLHVYSKTRESSSIQFHEWSTRTWRDTSPSKRRIIGVQGSLSTWRRLTIKVSGRTVSTAPGKRTGKSFTRTTTSAISDCSTSRQDRAPFSSIRPSRWAFIFRHNFANYCSEISKLKKRFSLRWGAINFNLENKPLGTSCGRQTTVWLIGTEILSVQLLNSRGNIGVHPLGESTNLWIVVDLRDALFDISPFRFLSASFNRIPR